MTEGQRIAFVMGQVNAMAAFLAALATIYPDHAELARRFAGLSQMSLSHLEDLPEASDQLIEGFQTVSEALRETLEERAG